MTTVAITREVSASIDRYELTHGAREPIDLARARAQHHEYERALESAGCTIVRVEPADDQPDAVFVEDAAIVFDELAILTRPGAVSRRAETPAVASVLSRYRELHVIEDPGTIDGGDVVVAGRRVFVGRSTRTNDDAIAQVTALLKPYGYEVRAVDVRGCLHLKSAATMLSENQLLVNLSWVSPESFDGFELLAIDPTEPSAANILRAGDTFIYSAACPRTRARLERTGLHPVTVDLSELAKAEGAVTCCSLIVR